MSERSEHDLLRQQLIRYAADFSALYKQQRTEFSTEASIERQLSAPENFAEIITNNKEMLSIFLYIEHIARSSHTVLITGETGVGKQLIAKSIHAASGVKGQLITINVAGLDDNIFTDTLFGHVKGAFTGADKARDGLVAKASGGTLLLDEMSGLSLTSQVKLLRLLEEGEYLPIGHDEHKKTNARVIAATNEDLWELQKQGKFRKDLNFRLRIHHIKIPPLRERTGDIPLLVDHFLDEAARDLDQKKPSIPRNLFSLLDTYSFPGNVRELRSMVIDAVSRQRTGSLSTEVFKSHIDRDRRSGIAQTEVESEETDQLVFPLELPTIKQGTQLLIDEALKRANGNQSIASRMLGITHQALSKRLKKNST